MKNISTLRLIEKTPIILASSQILAEIKEIVRVAPHEAQWFFTVKSVSNDSYWGYVLEELFIPEQFVGVANVETKGYQQIAFYKELKELYKNDIEKVNKTLQSMSCWCHSHGNLGSPSPSGTDKEQFAELKKAFEESKSPVIMMIFTKTHDYYTAIHDPVSGFTFEGVEIREFGTKVDHIKAIADAKFKTAPIVKPQTSQLPGFQNHYHWDWPTDTTPSKKKQPAKLQIEMDEEDFGDITDNPLWDQVLKLYNGIESTNSLEKSDEFVKELRKLISDEAIIITDILLGESSKAKLMSLIPDLSVDNIQALKEELLPQALENIACGVWFNTDLADAVCTANSICKATTDAEREFEIVQWIELMEE